MNCQRIVFWLVFVVYWCDGGGEDAGGGQGGYRAPPREQPRSTYTMLSESISQAVNNENLHETCSNDDFTCLATATNDRLGLEAIQALHQQLDDDANGNIDLSETGDFLREDLKLDSGYEKRQKAFHFNDDMHISVKELWEAWLRSEVHNWTVEQTTEWLTTCVELPQYADHFIRHRVMGANLPRLAANNNHYLSILGIKDPIHKQKISLKAMDVVLFGPPKDTQHHWKDLTMIVLLVTGGIGVWYTVHQSNKFKNHMSRMNHEMECLQSAEKTLENLQKELEQAKLAKENVASEKEDLEKKLMETVDSHMIHNSHSNPQVTQMREEIESLRLELDLARKQLQDRDLMAPPSLQPWLQLTHEIENSSYIKKKMMAEKQLQHAREACEKLKKKRSSLVGAFVSTHGKSIDDVDRSIVEARTSLNEVTQELKERVQRWRQIEALCGFNIINNNGLQSLENSLYRNYDGRAFGLRGRMSSQDELDDETSSIYSPSAGPLDSLQSHWKEVDSSGSEGSKHEDESTDIQKHTNVHFIIGGETAHWADAEQKPPRPQQPSLRSVSNTSIAAAAFVKQGSTVSAPQVPRSTSQESGVFEAAMGKHPKVSSYSDSSLEMAASSAQQRYRPPAVASRAIAREPVVPEDDVYSTDSSVIDDDGKKKKRKLFGFAKKGKPKD